jgi:2-oxoglutarate dehydrogenase E2 component (dihydrolipoamide succinyltransferase)
MKRTLSIAAVATFALAMPAFAAVITIDTGAPAPAAAAAPAAAGAPAAAAPAAPPPAPGTLLATFTPKAADAMLATAATTDAEVAAIAGVKDVTKVTVRQVKLGTAADAATVSKIKTDRAADIMRLQAAINANATFKGELMAKMVDAATVVAMEVAADGTITLYTLT